MVLVIGEGIVGFGVEAYRLIRSLLRRVYLVKKNDKPLNFTSATLQHSLES